MGLDSDKAATFFSLSTLPWTFKAVTGLLVDGVPLFGSRRRAYLLMSALVASAMWILMGLVPGNYTLLPVLAIALNTTVVFGGTTSGGLLVEAGQRFSASGRLSSLRVVAQNLGAALGYSVLIGVWNIGLMIGGKTGPMLYEHALHKNMRSLIWLNAGVTLAGVVLVCSLPRALVEQREDE